MPKIPCFNRNCKWNGPGDTCYNESAQIKAKKTGGAIQNCGSFETWK